MGKNEKVTPIRKRRDEPEAEDREQRMQHQGGRSSEFSEDRSKQHKGDQGISNRDIEEESARQAKVMPFREEANAGKRNKTGGKREVS